MGEIQERHWVFGRFGHIEFAGGGAPQARPASAMFAHEGCASVSDPQSGALLLYSNGSTIWDGNDTLVASGLGGQLTSTQGVTILPPIGAGTLYHVFTTGAHGGALSFFGFGPSHLVHSSYSVSGSGAGLNVQQVSAPTPLFGAAQHNERVAAASNSDGTGYWVISQPANTAQFHVVSVVGDTLVELPAQLAGAPTQGSIAEIGYMRVSPDGKTLAYCDAISGEIVFCDLDTATGQISYRCRLVGQTMGFYGLEFSADSQLVYYTFEATPSGTPRPNLFQAAVPQTDVAHSASQVLHSVTNEGEAFGTLQMAPDGKIYIIRNQQPNLSVITNPNVAGPGCGFVEIALDASGASLTFEEMGLFGLPNFAQMTEQVGVPCEDHPNEPELTVCEKIAHEVDEQVLKRMEGMDAKLKPCREREEVERCAPLELPKFEPVLNIVWKERDCGGIAPNGCTVMVLTVSNPYSNVSFSNVTVNRLRIMDANGSLIDAHDAGFGIVPLGPYCFGEIEPCSHVMREFTVHAHGIEAGEYRILVEGVCFDLCLHGDTEACFGLNVCKE